MPLVSAPQGRIARSRAKSPARSSILLLVSALLSWARSARAEQDGGAPDQSVAGPPVEVSYEATVRTSRQGANAQTTVVDADRFAGEARTAAELIATSPGVSVQNSGGPLPWKRRSLPSGVLPLDDDQAIVSNFIAGNVAGVDFRTGAGP